MIRPVIRLFPTQLCGKAELSPAIAPHGIASRRQLNDPPTPSTRTILIFLPLLQRTQRNPPLPQRHLRLTFMPHPKHLTPLRAPQTPPCCTPGGRAKPARAHTQPARLSFWRHHLRDESSALTVHPLQRRGAVFSLFGLVRFDKSVVKGVGEIARVEDLGLPFDWVAGL